MEIPLLKDILIIFGLSVVVLFIFHRLKIPTVVGFLLTGIMAGPHGLRLVDGLHEVEVLAEFGVVLLLFTIGMEFSFERLAQIKKPVLVGGSFQVFFTILVAFLLTWALGLPFGQAVFIGFLVSLSSTAIVLKLIQERAEVDSPHGRTTLGILIFQDIIIVPLMLFTPLLAGGTGDMGQALLILLAKGIGVILLVVVGTRWVVPQLLYQIAKTRDRELFLLSIVAICVAVAWVTNAAGLSLALGAFLAGLIISESEYSHQALGNVLPFKDVFTSFFFVSIGMLLNLNFLLEQSVLVFAIALVVLGLKTLIAGMAAIILGYPLRIVILVGLALSQVGEFSFILSKTGVKHGLLKGDVYQMFLAVSVLTMAATPFIIAAAPRVAQGVIRLPLPAKLKAGQLLLEEDRGADLKDHLIIIGFGLNGKNLARAASAAEIPYLILEMNTDSVRSGRENGEPIMFGDATQEAVLHHANIKEGRVAVVAISDPAATRRITEVLRRINPKIYILVRTRYLQELESLYQLGADEVIPEEFETSVEIFTRVLKKYLIPRDEIESFVAEVRADGYDMFRTIAKKSASFSDLKIHLPEIEISTFRINENSPAAEKTLAQIELRKKHGVTLLAIRRNAETLFMPHGDTKIQANDVVVVVGKRNKLSEVNKLFYDVNLKGN
ncbi:MAG: cation:proton antiporter [Clostridia bacterium]|nr:cation:proton antiporter [Clostridia bacterium]